MNNDKPIEDTSERMTPAQYQQLLRSAAALEDAGYAIAAQAARTKADDYWYWYGNERG